MAVNDDIWLRIVRIVGPRAIAALGPVAGDDVARVNVNVPVIGLKDPYATI